MSQIQISPNNPNQFEQTPSGGSYYSPLTNPSWALDFRMLALSQSNRLAIDYSLCFEGLLCYQQDVSKYYVYINTGSAFLPNQRTNTVNDWVELGDFLGAAGAATGAAPPNMAVQFNSASKFSGSADFVYDYQTQRVGIGLSTPTAKLDLLGSFQQGGLGLMAVGTGSHAQGEYTLASGSYSHAEGQYTLASGSFSHAEGTETTASGDYSHAEGASTKAIGVASHAEGQSTTALGGASHAEGYFTIASDNWSHAEGNQTIALGVASHAEGYQTTASGQYSHAEGTSTKAIGLASHAEGYFTSASGNYSHAAGNTTIAQGDYQSVIGQFNLPMGTPGSFIIGRGSLGSQKNLVYTSGSHFEITGSLYLTESRDELQEFFLMYNTQSGEVTYSNLSTRCVTWRIFDYGAHNTYTYTDCDGSTQTWSHSGGPGNEERYVCSPYSPTPSITVSPLYSITLYDPNGCNPPPSPIGPIETASISGTVRYDNTAQTPMTNTTVRLIDSSGTQITSVITNVSGDFNFGGGIPTGSYYVDFYTNKPWSGITAADALNIARHFSNTQLLTGIRQLAADVNASNTINASDTIPLLRRITFLRSSLTAGDWVFGSGSYPNFRGWFMVNRPQSTSPIAITGITSSDNGAVSSVGIPLTASRGHINLQYWALSVGDVNGSYTPNVNL